MNPTAPPAVPEQAGALAPPRREAAWRYGSAVVGVLLATLVRAWLHPLLRDQYPFPTFFVAAMVTAWYAGFGPALLSLGLGCLLATYFFIPPANSLGPIGGPQLLAMGLYLF